METLKTQKRGRKFWGESDIDGWMEWVLLKKENVGDLTDTDIICLLGMERIYNGPGMYFQHTGYVKRQRNRVLVKMHAGYDI